MKYRMKCMSEGCSVYKAFGPSMMPTVVSKNVLFYEGISGLFWSYQRGEIVIANCPVYDNRKITICKRIIATEGDTVINQKGRKLSCVPKDHVWLEGDNKKQSADSRSFGPVLVSDIIGRVRFKIWPPSFGPLRHPQAVKVVGVSSQFKSGNNNRKHEQYTGNNKRKHEQYTGNNSRKHEKYTENNNRKHEQYIGNNNRKHEQYTEQKPLIVVSGREVNWAPSAWAKVYFRSIAPKSKN